MSLNDEILSITVTIPLTRLYNILYYAKELENSNAELTAENKRLTDIVNKSAATDSAGSGADSTPRSKKRAT